MNNRKTLRQNIEKDGSVSLGKLGTYLRMTLRRAWLKYPARSEAIKRDRVAVEGQRHKWEVPCAICSTMLRLNKVRVDHRSPCGSLKTWDDVVPFIKTLFCDIDNLQCLCESCHKQKTKEERNG